MATPSISSLTGTGQSLVKIPTKTQSQFDLYNTVNKGAQPGIQSGTDFLSRLAGGDPSMFQQLEAPALRQLGELQGNIASRFSGAGARRSSGHALAQGSAATDLAERLQSQRLGLQTGAVSSLMDLYKQLMGEDLFDTFTMEEKKKKKWWQQAAQIGLPIAGAIGGSFIPGMGPMGASLGASLGSTFGNAIAGESSNPIDFAGISKLPTKWGS